MPLPARKTEKKYTYGDYAKWSEEERWELIQGIPHAMTAPSRIHQEVAKKLALKIGNFLEANKGDCKMYFAPFDVRLPEKDETEDKDISTVVQPDILVVCDPDKLDRKGMKGSPDFIIEILSPSTAGKDTIQKLYLYEKYGVKEYWVLDPWNQIVRVYLLGNDGVYSKSKSYARTDKLELKTLPGLTINLKDIFEEETEF